MTESSNGKPAAAEAFAAAMAELQTKLPRIKKGETAQVRSDKGSYSYSYADLADVSAQLLPLLGGLGLSFSARPTLNANGVFVLAYELLHVSGEGRGGEYPLPTGGTPQSLGSAITYGRRYCLCAATGVAPGDDDDDGAAASTYERAAPVAEPVESETDWEWVNGFETRVTAAGTQGELRGLYEELTVKWKRGGLTDDVGNQLLQLVTQRKNELEGAPA